MADNITLDAGSGGATVATDDDGTAHHQYVKLEAGADGTQTKILAGGGVESGALRVTIASDSTGVLSVDDNGSTLSVDGTVTANLGATDTAALAAVETAVELLDDTVYTDGTGTPSKAIGVAGTDGTNPQIISTNTSGHVNIADGGNVITVDGTVAVTGVATAANQTTLIGHVDGVEGLLTTIDGDTGTIAGAVSGTEMQVDVVGALPAGTNNIGDVDVLSVVPGTGATNLGKAEDAAHTTGDTGVMALAVRLDSAASFADTDGDYTPLQVDSAGALRVTGGGGGTEYTVDAAAPAAPTGSAGLMERDDALAALTEVEGDWTNMRANANGALWVKHDGTVTVDGSGVTQPVSHAALTELAAAIDTELQVDVVGALPAGTNNIGDVDVASSALPTGASTSAKQDTIIGHVDGIEALLTTIDADTSNLSVVGGGTEAAAIRVTLASDSTGVLSVDDNGSTLSVDDGGGALTVDYATTGSGTSTGALRVELPTNGTGTVGLNAGTNAIGKLAANSGVDIGDVDVTSISAGTNTIGDVGVKPRTSGGLSIFRSLDIDETEEDVKTSAGQVFGWYIFNAAASTRYVKFYNATAANVTVGSTTPVLTLPVPAGGAANVFSEIGIAFGTAISVAATTGVADADTGAPAANDVVINVLYS